MDALLPYLVAAGIMALLAWWWHVHFWSNRPIARRSRSPLWLGFTATAASALFLTAGLIGLNLSKHGRFVAGTAWTDGVIWRQVAVGLVLVPVAIHLLRRGARDVGLKPGRS